MLEMLNLISFLKIPLAPTGNPFEICQSQMIQQEKKSSKKSQNHPFPELRHGFLTFAQFDFKQNFLKTYFEPIKTQDNAKKMPKTHFLLDTTTDFHSLLQNVHQSFLKVQFSRLHEKSLGNLWLGTGHQFFKGEKTFKISETEELNNVLGMGFASALMESCPDSKKSSLIFYAVSCPSHSSKILVLKDPLQPNTKTPLNFLRILPFSLLGPKAADEALSLLPFLDSQELVKKDQFNQISRSQFNTLAQNKKTLNPNAEKTGAFEAKLHKFISSFSPTTSLQLIFPSLNVILTLSAPIRIFSFIPVSRLLPLHLFSFKNPSALCLIDQNSRYSRDFVSSILQFEPLVALPINKAKSYSESSVGLVHLNASLQKEEDKINGIFEEDAPDWRSMRFGLNYEVECENKDCDSFKKKSFSICFGGEEERFSKNGYGIPVTEKDKNCSCCGKPAKLRNLLFSGCNFNLVLKTILDRKKKSIHWTDLHAVKKDEFLTWKSSETSQAYSYIVVFCHKLSSPTTVPFLCVFCGDPLTEESDIDLSCKLHPRHKKLCKGELKNLEEFQKKPKENEQCKCCKETQAVFVREKNKAKALKKVSLEDIKMFLDENEMAKNIKYSAVKLHKDDQNNDD